MDRSERGRYRKPPTKARERYEARRRRRDAPAPQAVRLPAEGERADTPPRRDTPRRVPQVSLDGVRSIDWGAVWATVQIRAAETWWHARRNPTIWRGLLVGVVVAVVIYMLASIFATDVPRGVRVTGLASVGGLSTNDAIERLNRVWADEITLELIIDAENSLQVRPSELGIYLDSQATVAEARAVGFGAFPFGAEVEPIASMDFIAAQNYMLTIADQVNTRPSNARYELVGGEVVGVPGRVGRRLDSTTTLDYLRENLAFVLERGRIELRMTPLQADFNDPAPYLDAARQLVAQPFELRGYDPVTDQSFTWPIRPDTLIGWVQAGPGSLALDLNAFEPYLTLLNETLNIDDDNSRYLEPEETVRNIDSAISGRQSYADLRVRHRPFTYTVVSGDRAYGIARRTGLPFYLIERANSGLNLDVLSIGDVLNIPSPDAVLTADPVPHKRIIVDLNRQYLMAFENNQVVYEWPISSGVSNAPTSPGVFQILNHAEKAWGSSSTLCDSAGVVCGQWEMNWFMGIYEVSPGLVNGFHGSVLLPNGGLLGDGVVGRPVTFGCLMSTDDQARMLYEWAEVGTVVEIISQEFPPTSDLGRYVHERLHGGSA